MAKQVTVKQVTRVSNREISDVFEPSTRQPKQLAKQLPKQLLINGQQPKLQPVAFMFPRQGAQYVNMGLELAHYLSTPAGSGTILSKD
ncbi:MAG: hypothetical protein F6K65_38300 [Moorea sp. SIO3C2]|nr:hypothetical protein [Moorena sp. SIO3C2]